MDPPITLPQIPFYMCWHPRAARDKGLHWLRRSVAKVFREHLAQLRSSRGPIGSSYLYYPAEEFGFDIAAQHKNIGTWLDRMKALPGWAHPYDLMPGHPLRDAVI
jgi:hypothetical protein